jgi:hypothetical protein
MEYRQFSAAPAGLRQAQAPAADGAAANGGKTVIPDPIGDLAPGADRILALPQLRIDRIPLTAPLKIRRDVGPFLLYSCVRGAAAVQLPLAGGQQLDFPFRAGETLLVPAECAEFTLGPTDRDTVLLETTVIRNDADPYINPAASPTLPEDAA